MTKAHAEIGLANLIWGLGFVATVWSLKAFDHVQILFFRFLFAGLIGLSVFLVKDRKKFMPILKAAFLPALFLILEIFFQISSLQYIGASEGGFLFVMYVVMVPLIEFILYRRKLKKHEALWMAVGLFGSFLMMKQSAFALNKGALMMLLSALFAGSHIIIVDHIDKKDLEPFYLNAFQLLIGSLIIAPFYFLSSHPRLNFEGMPFGSLIFLIVGPTLIAFYLQIKAQKEISPSVISVLFLLEAAFAALFAFFFLQETLSLIQFAGAALICFSALAISLAENDSSAKLSS